MSLFRASSSRQIDLGLALLRIVAGVTFAVHGYQKVFIYGFAGVTDGFTKMGIPLPGIVGPAIGLLEFFGGIALIVGFLSRPLALALAADMLGAIAFAHFKNGFSGQGGYEFVLSLFAASMTIAIAGAGAFSVDRIIDARTNKQSNTDSGMSGYADGRRGPAVEPLATHR